ncbi:MAG: hypothetical protein LUE29_07325 [Lachnospiraceae bacterium]|nr:hypothetical protein [Lachnospiraceae bacterium]
MARKKSENYFSEYVKVAKPNAEKMAALTRAAKGDRTLNEFAAACGIYASTLSRIINKNVTSKCTEQVILAIAENAQAGSGVTLEALLAAQGLAKVSFTEGEDGVVVSLQQDSNPENFPGKAAADVKRALAYRETAILEEAKKIILDKMTGTYVVEDEMDVIDLPGMHCDADFVLHFAADEKAAVSAAEEENPGVAADEETDQEAAGEAEEEETAEEADEADAEEAVSAEEAADESAVTAKRTTRGRKLKVPQAEKWAFVVNNPARQPAPYRLHQILAGAYLNPYAARGIKVSLVLVDKKEYKDILKRLNGAQAYDEVSVIFVDRKHKKAEEFVIPQR